MIVRKNLRHCRPALLVVVLSLLASSHAFATENNTNAQPGSDVVDSQLSRTSVVSFAALVSSQINRFGGNLAGAILTVDLPEDIGGQRGLSAGLETQRLSGWTNFADTDIEEDVVATRYKGDIRTYMVGLDYQVDDKVLVGVAFGLESAEIDTAFNAGTINTRSKTISPYASYRLNDMFSVDGVIGYSEGDIDQVRIFGVPITSETTADRYFAQANVNMVTDVPEVDNLLLSGQLGYLWAIEKVNGFTETNGNTVAGKTNPLQQAQLSLRGGYSFFDVADNWVFHPYTQLRLMFETQSNGVEVGLGQAEHPNDRHEAQMALGFDFFSGSQLSGNFEYSRSFARQDFKSDVLSVNLRLKFGVAE